VHITVVIFTVVRIANAFSLPSLLGADILGTFILYIPHLCPSHREKAPISHPSKTSKMNNYIKTLE
jgi:hypothetical protein